MKNIFTAIIIGILASVSLMAENESHKTEFVAGADFEMKFDNREFYRSRFSRSMTIFGARLTPSVGLNITQSDGISHKIMTGIDVLKDFGASPISETIAGSGTDETSASLNHKDLFKELTLWYRMEKINGDNSLEIYAGIFPRRFMEGNWSTAFFSDSLSFYDNNLEGMLLKFRRPNAYYELGCDWMGQYGQSRREKFMVFSSGEGKVARNLSLGYSAYMYHFACSREVIGVVDNMLINPYISMDLKEKTKMDTFTLTAGWLQAFQHDRLNVGHYVFPCGAELRTDIGKWNFGLRNHLFIGTDMMPYYNSNDIGDIKYGSRLYMGDPFFRVHDDGSKGPGTYDRMEIYYSPKLGKLLDIKVSAIFHFNKAYSGCQQMVTLRFNLHETIR